MVTYGLPYPPHAGSRIRNLNTIRALSRHHSIIVLSLTWDAADRDHVAALRRHCEHVDVVLNHRSRAQSLAALVRGSLSDRPLAAFRYYFPAMADRIREVVATRPVDAAIFDQIYVAPYIDALPRDRGCRTILSLHDVPSSQYRSMVGIQRSAPARARHALWARLMTLMERRYLDRFDHHVVVSAREADLLRARHYAVPISVIENGIDAFACRPLPEPAHGDGILFVGDMQYGPNADAARHLADDIFPIVRAAMPRATLCIVGQRPAVAPGVHVTVTGRVADLTPYYRAAKVVVVPLRAGGGTRLKILEAMALGRPVVSTPIGCEGLDVVDREHLCVADTPARFARDVVELLSSADHRRRLVRAARRLVETRYDWSIINRKLTALYDDLLGNAPAVEPR